MWLAPSLNSRCLRRYAWTQAITPHGPPYYSWLRIQLYTVKSLSKGHLGMKVSFTRRCPLLGGNTISMGQNQVSLIERCILYSEGLFLKDYRWTKWWCCFTLCCTSPYSRPGSSQKEKSWRLHSALNDGALTDPNISSLRSYSTQQVYNRTVLCSTICVILYWFFLLHNTIIHYMPLPPILLPFFNADP